MSKDAAQAEVLVTGATGFIGRWLLAALTRRGQIVAALVRGAAQREDELRSVVERLGGDGTRLVVVEGDVESVGLGLRVALPSVRVVYHLAARFAFGLEAEVARRTNVEGTRNTVAWACALPSLQRFVFLGGYRMTTVDPATLDEATLRRAYAAGAYEGSKFEAYAVFRALAREHSMPWSAVHPSALIGDSRTGETLQTVGLGDTVKQLFDGKLPALAGSARTFVPVVTVDYLAEYLATVPLRDASEGKDLVVFDPASPPLRELVRLIAKHLGVPLPSRTVPVWLLRALPKALTGIERESLHFLSEDRYDTAQGDAHAAAVGLEHPPLVSAVQRWCDYLVATRFLTVGASPGDERATGRLIAGTFAIGEPERAEVILLHGIPFDSEAMAPLAQRLGRVAARLDHPGMGRSAPRSIDSCRSPGAWLSDVIATRSQPVALVGHSLGAGVAVDYAAKHPASVAALVLIAPAFLGGPAPRLLRWPAAVAFVLGRMRPDQIAQRFLAEGDTAEARSATVSAHRSLARRGAPRRMAEALADAARDERRAELRTALRTLSDRGVPVLIVHAASEPLRHDTHGATVVCLDDAGHNPHLTHVEPVASAVRSFLDAHAAPAVDSAGTHLARCEARAQHLPIAAAHRHVASS